MPDSNPQGVAPNTFAKSAGLGTPPFNRVRDLGRLAQLEGEGGELGVKRADQWIQGPDRVASKLGMDRTCLAHGLKGRARRAAQRDQESGGVVAVHFDGLAELLIEAEADEHDPIPVNLQLRALAKLS